MLNCPGGWITGSKENSKKDLTPTRLCFTIPLNRNKPTQGIMETTHKSITTTVDIPPDQIPGFQAVMKREHRNSIRNTANYLVILGLQKWNEEHGFIPESVS